MEYIKPIKEMTGKERVSYIWCYYKVHILVVIAVIASVIGLIYHYATYRTPLLNIMMINRQTTDTTALNQSLDDFLTENGYPLKSNTIDAKSSLVVDMNDSSSYQQQTALEMLIATQSYSAFFSDPENFEVHSEQELFRPITDFMTDEQIARYENDLLYATNSDTGEKYPCGIHLTAESTPWLETTESYSDCYFGVLFSNSDDETVSQFVNYVLQ